MPDVCLDKNMDDKEILLLEFMFHLRYGNYKPGVLAEHEMKNIIKEFLSPDADVYAKNHLLENMKASVKAGTTSLSEEEAQNYLNSFEIETTDPKS